mmetsp:Transcript_8290/g.15620  ORF Transcript_8290/g.15620 Transcript_8290/m.15620 type:complete len:89 (-) Transcript_8290:215-481(-)
MNKNQPAILNSSTARCRSQEIIVGARFKANYHPNIQLFYNQQHYCTSPPISASRRKAIVTKKTVTRSRRTDSSSSSSKHDKGKGANSF